MSEYAERLREMCSGCRLRRRKWGVSKTLDSSQKRRAAGVFHAEGDRLSASKRLIDPKDDAYKACGATLRAAGEEWERSTLPYPDAGVRLIRREHVEDFERRIAQHQTELDQRAAALQERYATLLSEARLSLGDLFDLSDYPAEVSGLFGIEVEYPAIGADPSLLQVSSGLYEREQERIAARVDQAVRMAEEAFTEEFSGLIRHLCERLEGLNDGQTKRFADSNVTNLREFFERFRRLSIGSDDRLEELVGDAQRALEGVRPDWLKGSAPLRDRIREQLGGVQERLDDLMVARPKRAISFGEEV